MLVGPPEQLKTQFVAMLEDYPRTLILSDLTTRELVDFHQDLGGQYKTLGFTAFEKISQRNEDVAQNLIGHLTALSEEGFRGSYKTDKRQRTYRAKVFLVGAIPRHVYDLNYKDWLASGFHRRFLWPSFQLSDPDTIRNSIVRWKPVNLRADSLGFEIPTEPIPYEVSSDDRAELSKLLRSPEGTASPLILLSKIYAVLKWRYRVAKDPARVAMAVMRDFAEALKGIADLEIGAVAEILEVSPTLKQRSIKEDGQRKRKKIQERNAAKRNARNRKVGRRNVSVDESRNDNGPKHGTGKRRARVYVSRSKGE